MKMVPLTLATLVRHVDVRVLSRPDPLHRIAACSDLKEVMRQLIQTFLTDEECGIVPLLRKIRSDHTGDLEMVASNLAANNNELEQCDRRLKARFRDAVIQRELRIGEVAAATIAWTLFLKFDAEEPEVGFDRFIELGVELFKAANPYIDTSRYYAFAATALDEALVASESKSAA